MGGDEDIWDAYSVPTRNMPGYDDHDHYEGFKTLLDQEAEKFGNKKGNRRRVQDFQNTEDDGQEASPRREMPKNKKKPEPNWSFKKGERNNPFGQKTANNPFGKKTVNITGARPDAKQFKPVGRKPEPKLVRDGSKDLERITGKGRNTPKYKPKQDYDYQDDYDTDDIYEDNDQFEVEDITYVKKKQPIISRKPEPCLLRDTSADTAKLHWEKGSDKKSPFVKQKKGMSLVSTGKKVGKLITEDKSGNRKTHIMKRLGK